jgi:hypothetical protein
LPIELLNLSLHWLRASVEYDWPLVDERFNKINMKSYLQRLQSDLKQMEDALDE